MTTMMGVLGFICNNNDDVHDSNKMIEGSTLTTIANARLGFRMGTTSIIRRKNISMFKVENFRVANIFILSLTKVAYLKTC